ncbi:hypothetical protein GCM10011380_11230 [Sphingomonas metalli]|uniref:Uncharacterized protein n=1 Tax=Sphingomonas metalli TaxID=1779358 RepID=A0A916SYC7_9SPHN|nr:hypothetical protein [Sphingomonas metalli]GGB23278.1 hypothetical protein GCM10011380_11230 [Sphingomonas metalli]
MGSRRMPIEGYILLYFLAYLPNIVVTALLTRLPNPALGRPMTGLETLPATLILNLVMTYVFIWWSGWHREAHGVRLLGRRIPVPTRFTLLSGIGTAFIIFTVPLSYTFEGVSIPFIQLLMRGDVLLIAPLIDLLFGRRVRWWSWAAIGIVGLALTTTLYSRGGFALPPLAMLAVILYTLGYFIRLSVMTAVGKTGDPADVRRYFVEEKIFALPLSIAILAALSAAGLGDQADELRFGFVGIWTDPSMVWLVFVALTMTIVSVFSVIILLDPRENAYCVPLERASSLVAGVAASLILAAGWGMRPPSGADLFGAALLIGSIVLLSLAPRWQAARRARPAAPAPD